MTVTWEVDDGYCGGSRQQHTEIDDDELAECETEEERQKLIEEYVQNDFEQLVSWNITDQTEVKK